MSVIRLSDNRSLRPLHAVMLALVVMTLGGGYLLLSAPESTTLVDGAIPWHAQSPLRAVVQILCLNYQMPTLNAGEVKNYLLGVGAGLAALALAIAILSRDRSLGEECDPVTPPTAVEERLLADGPLSTRRPAILRTPVFFAQAAALLYLLWSFASSRWSVAPELSLGATLLLTIFLLWSLSLAQGLSPRAAVIAVNTWIAVASLTAALALWYFYGRNWTIRAKFPFGNPNFLSTCLIPGMLLSIAQMIAAFTTPHRVSTARRILTLLAAIAVLALSAWAFYLTESRGPALGLGAGLLAMAFFALRGRARLAPLALALVLLVAGWSYFSARRFEPSPTGRDATLRFRTYTWEYAWRMFREKPFTGHGQGGYVLAADAYVAGEDALRDPQVFTARIEHAHNEWLEVLADLGIVGLLLLAALIALTLRGAMARLAREPAAGIRWPLIALLAALVALLVEESFGVGLRVSGVPTAFYTALGLVWALSAAPEFNLLERFSVARVRRLAAAALAGAVGLITLILIQQDFRAARDTYQTAVALDAEDYDRAAQLALQATSRLNPQRALTNLFRLAEAQTHIAARLSARGADRAARARAGDLVDVNLMALADNDRRESERYAAEASRVLNELLVRSPGFLHHGRLEYALNRLLADHAAARQDDAQRRLYLKNALTALERDIRRLPYDPELAAESVEAAIAADSPLDLPALFDRLARPLRHHRLSPEILGLLQRAATHPGYDAFLNQFTVDPQAPAPNAQIRESSVAHARTTDGVSSTAEPLAVSPVPHDTARAVPSVADNSTMEMWFPEKLRLVAAAWFLRGDYARAEQALGRAAARYQEQFPNPPFGAASCFAELADCQFFHQPDEPGRAARSAEQALALAPQSQLGRQLRESVRHRMVDYALAGDDENVARDRLRLLAATTVDDDLLDTEVALRYRRLCESLLRRREGQLLRKPTDELLPKLLRWSHRAIELNPNDPFAHFLAADLTFHAGDDSAAADHMARALEAGLPPESALRFLEMAREKSPDSATLTALWTRLNTAKPEPVQPDGGDSVGPQVEKPQP